MSKSKISQSLKATKSKRKTQTCKVFEVKVSKSHLSSSTKDKLNLSFEECFKEVRKYIDKNWTFIFYWHSDNYWSAEFTFFIDYPKKHESVSFIGMDDNLARSAINKLLDKMEKYYSEK